MGFGFERPAWLWGLLLAPYAFWHWRRLFGSPQIPRRHRAVMALRPLTLALLVLAIAGLQWNRPDGGVDHWVLIDGSDSISPQARQEAEQLWRELRGRLRPVDRAGVIVFSAAPAVARPMEPAEGAQPGGLSFEGRASHAGHATNVEEALRMALHLADPDRAVRILLASDGAQSQGDAMNAVPALLERGTPVDVFPLRQPFEHEALIETISVPERVNAGEPFTVQVVVASSAPTAADFFLIQDGQVVAETSHFLSAGRQALTFGGLQVHGPQSVLEARIRPEWDTFPQNNAAQALITSSESGRVLAVTEAGRPSQVAAALRAQGLNVDETRAPDLPGRPEALSRLYDAVILENVSAFSLSETQMQAIDRFVREGGGGLVAVAGPNSFTLGGYAGTPLAELLPLEMSVPQELVIPSLAMLLVIDRSGSMGIGEMGASRMDLAKEAAIGILDVLSPNDLFGVLAFDHQPEWIVPMVPVENRAFIAQAIAGLQPGGGTILHPAMQWAFESMQNVEASIRHVIVLSDGETEEAPFEELAASMAAEQITLSTVSIGREANRALMRSIALHGLGRAYFTENIREVPRILATEAMLVSPPDQIEEPFRPRIVSSEAFLAGLREPLPELHGAVLVTPKPAAQVHIAGPADMPILATWRYGLGRVAAFTSSADGSWAPQWLAWEAFAPFWSQLVRWSLRPPEPAEFDGAFEIVGGAGRVAVDAVTAEGAFRNFLTLRAEVAGPGGARKSIALEQTGPGRYEGVFEAAESGAWLVSIYDESDPAAAALTLSHVSSYPLEYRLLDPPGDLLERLAQATGGAVLTDAADLAGTQPRSTASGRPLALWPWLAAMALAAFLADVGVRYTSREAFADAWQRARAGLRSGGRRLAPDPDLARRVEAARRKAAEAPVRREEERGGVGEAQRYLARKRKRSISERE